MRGPFLAALLIPLLVRAAGADCRAAGADCSLREAAAQAGVLVGAAVIERGFDTDPLYAPTLAAEFDSVTHEHVFKWDAIQPSRGVYDFAAADRLVDFAEANGIAVRGHTLLWEQQLIDSTPAYVTDVTDPSDLRALVTDHIQTVVGRYRGRVGAWDVVNEPFGTVAPALYENHFAAVLGPGYIAEAFTLAHAADPEAVLFLNEVLVDAPGPKFDALLALVRDLREQGVPLHGVGLQGHFFAPVDPAGLQQNLERLAALGVVVELTEVDVLLRNRPDALAFQGREYYGLAAACLAVPACRRITMWGFTDRYTWIDTFLGPGLSPLPLDESYAPKPAYVGLRDGLLSTTTPVRGLRLRIRDDATRPGRRALEAWATGRIEAPAPGSIADPTVRGGVLALASAPLVDVWGLAASGWRSLGNGRGYEYRDTSGPVRRVLLRTRKQVVVRLRGGPLGLDVAPLPLELTLSTGTAAWCMRFAEAHVFRQGKRLLAGRSAAPASCPAPRLIGD